MKLKTEAEMRKAREDSRTEAPVERYFVEQARRFGCKQRKLTQWYAEDGWPDRLIVWPGGVTHYVETKRPKGGKLEPRQKVIIPELRALGAVVEVLHSKEEVDEYFQRWAKQYAVAALKPTRKRSARLLCIDEL